MRIVIGIIALAAVLNNAAALQCFLCVASLTSDCFNGDASSMIVIDCDANTAINITISPIMKQDLKVERDVPTEMKCFSYVVDVFDMTLIRRGCAALPEGVDICELSMDDPGMLACSWCDEDLCNYDVLEIPTKFSKLDRPK